MPSSPPQPLTWKLFWLWVITIGCAALLWGLARLDWVVPDDLALLWGLHRLGTPRPEMFVAVLGICVVGSVCILLNILLRLRDSDQTIVFANLVIGLGASAAAGYFIYQVLWASEPIAMVSQPKQLPAPVTKIRLFNLNVLHGYPEFELQDDRLKNAAKLLRHLDPDVMVFQEAWNTNDHGNMVERLCRKGNGLERLSNTIDFNYVYGRANGSRSLIGFEEGAAIVSRLPFMQAKRILLEPREPWWENRIALFTKLDIGAGEMLTLVGIHLSNSSSADAQAEYLLGVVRDYSPDIIAGDFNSEPDSAAIKAMLQGGFVEAVPTKNDLVKGPFIDHMFLSAGFQKRWSVTQASWIVTSQPAADETVAVSDHDGILVDLKRN